MGILLETMDWLALVHYGSGPMLTLLGTQE